MTAAFLRNFMPYGAPDLQDAERPHLSRALALGSLLASLLFAAAWSLSLVLEIPSIPAPVPIESYDVSEVNVLQPPPLLPSAREPHVAIARSPAVAIPVPVPDAMAPIEEPVAGPSDGPPTMLGETTGPPMVAPIYSAPPEGPVNREGDAAIVDELPVPIRVVEPPYPELARQARVEGLVIVNVLVGKDGRVVEARLHPIVNIVLLNEASLEAARKWVFTPAIDRGRPVAVWVTIPINYRLY